MAPARRAAAKRTPPPRVVAPAAVVRLPVSPARMRRLAMWALILLAVAAIIGAVVALRVPQRLVEAMLAASVRAGFVVGSADDVRVEGLDHLDRAAVVAAVLDDGSTATLGMDLDMVRARLLKLDWVRDAVVARRLPDRIEVTIVERVPAALWQRHGRLALIDATGHVLAIDDLSGYAKLPLIVGTGAELEYPSLRALLASQPALGHQVDAASWVGGRRWDLMLKSHETVSLPEGYADAQAALAAFARADEVQHLVGGGFERFDLRLPGKMVVRLPKRVTPEAKAKGTAI